jgi:ABC-type nitrate/sulfonate/bicarbonate transport system substrate-binding protein
MVVLALAAALVSCQPAAAPAAGPAPAPAAAPVTSAELAAAPAPPSAAATAPAERLKVAWVSVSAGYLPLWAAQELGMFEKRGLAAELVFTSGPGAVQSLLAREVDIAYTDGSAIVRAALASGDVVLLGSSSRAFPFMLIAHPSIQRVEDLRGKRLGIARSGSSTDFAARYLLRGAGLTPGADVTLVQTVSTPERLQAMMAGGIDAGLFSEPGGYEARKQGYVFLYDLATMGVEYPNTGIGTLRGNVTERPAALRAFIGGLVEGIAWVKHNRAEALEMLSRHTQIDDPESLAATYEEHAPRFPQAPYVTAASIATILESIRDEEPRAADARVADLTDDRFVRELDESGYIRSLYP